MAGLSDTRWVTWANALTALRLLAAAPLYLAITNAAFSMACLLFWLAVASDLIDGRIARARGETSAFGGLLDHATDALFVTAGLLALVRLDLTPQILPYLVLAAFAQYVLDSKALHGRTLRASALGRWNGILYFVPVGALVSREWLGLDVPSDRMILATGWILAFSTLVSMSDRLVALAQSLRDPARDD